MLLKKTLATVTIGSMFAVSGMMTLPTLLAEDAPAPPAAHDADVKTDESAEVREMPEVQTFTGHVVGVHAYLANANEADGAKGLLGFLAPESPIALVASDTTVLSKLTPGQATYLIVFDPQDTRSRDAYGSVREMVWKDVSISGRVYDRNGLHAIVIMGVHDLPAAAADQPDESADLHTDRID